MLRAIIFDCDGVLGDTETLHYRALMDILRDEDIRIPRGEYDRDLRGLSHSEAVRRALATAGRSIDEARLSALMAEKSARYRAMAEGRVRAVPGAVALVRRLARDWPLAVCSGSSAAEVELVLRGLRIADCFKAVVTAADVQAAKPDPEGYRLALARLNQEIGGPRPIEPGECVVIEDSGPGVAAALAAGMRVVRLAELDAIEEIAAGPNPPDIVVSRLRYLTDAVLEGACATPSAEISFHQPKGILGQYSASNLPTSGAIALPAIAGVLTITILLIIGVKYFAWILIGLFVIGLPWLIVYGRRARRELPRQCVFRGLGSNKSPARIACYGPPMTLAQCRGVEDVPFEPIVIARTTISAVLRRWWVLLLCTLAVVPITIILDHLARTMLSWFHIQRNSGGLGGVTYPLVVLLAYGMARFRPMYYRVVPGRLDLLQLKGMDRVAHEIRSMDLRRATVRVHFHRHELVLEPPSGEAWTIPLQDFSAPLPFVQAVIQGAISSYESPKIPPGELTG